MGTNYYLKSADKCPTCGHSKTPDRHIGKASAGWCFSLHVYPEEGINDLSDWLPLFEQGEIYDRGIACLIMTIPPDCQGITAGRTSIRETIQSAVPMDCLDTQLTVRIASKMVRAHGTAWWVTSRKQNNRMKAMKKTKKAQKTQQVEPVKQERDDHGRSQAAAQLESIKEMVAALRKAEDNDDAREEAQQIIQEDPLSVEVRSGWHALGDKGDADEFRILLCTGGPACQIVGDLDEHMEPCNPRLQYQDWFTPWTDYPLTVEETEAVTAYCREFYFGE